MRNIKNNQKDNKSKVCPLLAEIDFNTEERDCVVGHIPREFSNVTYHFIKLYNGQVVCQITNEKMNRSARADGLIIRCCYQYI